MAHVTEHAVTRYIERIEPWLSRDDVRAMIEGSSRAIDVAAAFGAQVVRIGNGAKLVLQDDIVVTVLNRRFIATYNRNAGAVA